MKGLSESQRRAVEHLDGPCLVLAGPGSGKTRVIAHRIVNMVGNCNVAANRILAISFTKASSVEMKKRTLKLGGDEGLSGGKLSKVHFGTFHSVFFRIIRAYDNVSLDDLISEGDRFRLVKNIVKSLKIKNFSDDDISDVLNEISYVKNELIEPSKHSSKVFSDDEFRNIYMIYEREKKRLSKIDFDDMLIRTYSLLVRDSAVLAIVRNAFRYILIDEFQDINRVQFEVIRLISAPYNNLFVVGDEDQSIYGFRGARPDFMINFGKYFQNAEVITLETNYRSRKNIVETSGKIIRHNKNRYEKMIKPFSTEDGDIKLIMPKDVDDEAAMIAKSIKATVESHENAQYSQFAVLYRTNRQSRAFVDAFMDSRIPFVLKDSTRTIYDHWVSLDIISYLKVSLSTGSSEDWLRIINKPYRYVSKASLQKAAKSSDFFMSILNDDIKHFQRKNLEQLYEDLNYIRTLRPEYAINFIRTTLDYDRYILEYCRDRKIKSAQIVEILDEIEESSKPYRTIFEFFRHIEDVREEMKKMNEKNRAVTMGDVVNDGVILSTMHSAKGLEFEHVYIAGVCENIIPYRASPDEKLTEERIEEERRLMYVAMTRARQNLIVSSPKKRFNKKAGMSMFIDEIF